MKNKFKSIILIATILFTVIGCKKKTDDPVVEEPAVVTPAPQANTITEVFTTHGAAVVTSTVSASAAQSFTTTGLKIEVPANAFQTLQGGTVTGNVNLSIKGILNKRDIILSGAPANGSSTNKLIATKGCIKVSASQSGQTLRLNPGQNFYVNVAEAPGATASNTMRKFIASKVSTADSNICWKADPDSANLATHLDTLTGKTYYKARIDSANWLNVGQKWDTVATKTAVIVTLGSQFNKTNTAVYISLNGILVVGALYEISPSTPNTFRISNIPVGRVVNIVGVAVINGQHYSAVMPATITLGFSQPLNMQAASISQIEAQLNALP